MTADERYAPKEAAASVYRRLLAILDQERYVRAVAEKYRDIGPFWTELEAVGGGQAVQAVREILDGEAL